MSRHTDGLNPVDLNDTDVMGPPPQTGLDAGDAATGHAMRLLPEGRQVQNADPGPGWYERARGAVSALRELVRNGLAKLFVDAASDDPGVEVTPESMDELMVQVRASHLFNQPVMDFPLAEALDLRAAPGLTESSLGAGGYHISGRPLFVDEVYQTKIAMIIPPSWVLGRGGLGLRGLRSVPARGLRLTPNAIGKAGEQAVKSVFEIGPKVRIEVNGRFRIPDGMTRDVLTEVKNVKSLSFTRQLRDFADFARATGRRFDLFVRPNTKPSGPLLQAIQE